MGEVENRIFVSNLPLDANQDIVATYFSQFGSTTDIYLPLAPSKEHHKGIAYVTFAEAAAREYALAQTSHDILGQQVNVQVCLPKGQGKGMPGSSAAGDNRIFVQGIGQEVPQEEVQAYFAQFGTWSDIYMPKGAYTAGHKGICFVSYNTADSVTQVMNMGPHIIGGQQVSVDIAIARDVKGGGKKGSEKGFEKGFGKAAAGKYAQQPHQQYQSPQQSHQPRLIPGLNSYQQPQQVYQPPQHHYRPAQPAAQPHFNNPYGVTPPPRPAMAGAAGPPMGRVLPGRLFITKMSPGLTKEDLEQYFSQFGELNDVYMPPGKLIAFVGFSEPSVAVSVAAMHTHEVRQGLSVVAEPAVERPAGGGKGKGDGKSDQQPRLVLGYSPY